MVVRTWVRTSYESALVVSRADESVADFFQGTHLFAMPAR